MEIVGDILIYGLTLIFGFGLQFFLRWAPQINMLISYLLVLLFPPSWSLGLVSGIWVASAFFTFNPENEHSINGTPTISWLKVLLYSIWTFVGFILTSVFLWKLKGVHGLNAGQREMLAWLFLIVVEICLYKIIARLSPSLYRVPLGYGMAVIDFLMLFYWLYSWGIYLNILVFLTLLIINPLLLIWIDLPANAFGDPFLRRKS